LEYISTVFTTLQIPGDFSEIPGDLSEIFSEIISKRSLGISGHLEICENGREIPQKCPSMFVNPQLNVGKARRVPGDSEECLGEEIIPKLHRNTVAL